jgi:hypothetical protein
VEANFRNHLREQLRENSRDDDNEDEDNEEAYDRSNLGAYTKHLAQTIATMHRNKKAYHYA